jgi:hypothetical protein
VSAPLGFAASRLDAAAVHLGGWSGDTDPGPAAFGAGLPGRLGELGRELHTQWSTQVASQGRTAAALADRLSNAAATLRTASGGYATAEDTAAHRATEAGGDG